MFISMIMPDFGSHFSNNVVSMKILAVVEKKFLSLLDVLVGVDTDPVIPVHHENFHITIRLGTVIGESYLSPDPKH